MRTLTLAQARRAALAAQGFGGAARTLPLAERSQVGMRQVQRVIDQVAQFQIDTITVVERAHYLPLFSRLGSYDKQLLDRALSSRPRRLFEYWGHAASMIDITLEPALRFRMEANRANPSNHYLATLEKHPQLRDQILTEINARGAITAREIEHEEVRDRSHWGWNWSAVKTVLEQLHSNGELVSAGRTSGFERRHDLRNRVLPAPIAEAETPNREESVTTLVRRAAKALGVASASCLSDYFRLRTDDTSAAITTLEAKGELVPVRVTGWDRPLWWWHEAKVPRTMPVRTLVSPFDSLIFERRRTHELFGLFYRIEIYVPEAKRQHGYYVYPFLLGTDFVARVDLKADRANGALIVKAAWCEPGHDHDASEVARHLAAELRELGHWTHCPRMVVLPKGDLADDLSSAVQAGHEATVWSAP